MSTSSRRELFQVGAKAALAAGLSSCVSLSAAALEPPARSGGPRFKVGCCAYSYRQYLQAKTNPITLYDFLEACAGWNIDGVELTAYYFPQPLTAAEVHKIARRAFLLGLEVAGTAVGNSFCQPPGPERDSNIARVKQWVDYAVDMGAPCLRVFAGSPPRGVDLATGRKWVIESIETCLPYAEQRGIYLAMENHGGVVSNAEGTLEIVEAIKSDWFGLKWDSHNYTTADPYSDLAKVAPYAVTTHIKTEVAPGGKKQPADYARILGLLRAVNYRGYLLLEYEAAQEPRTAVPLALATLQRLTSFTPISG
jgi:sugar phosphate isomerase/epimerase